MIRDINRIKIAYLAYCITVSPREYLDSILFDIRSLCNKQEVEQINKNLLYIYEDRSWFKYKFSGACRLPRNHEEYIAIRDLIEEYCVCQDMTIHEYDIQYSNITPIILYASILIGEQCYDKFSILVGQLYNMYNVPSISKSVSIWKGPVYKKNDLTIDQFRLLTKEGYILP